jgi:hypothetical protein
MTRPDPLSDKDLASAVRSALVRRADVVDVSRAEIHARVSAARQGRRTGPTLGSTLRLFAVAALVVAGGAALVFVGSSGKPKETPAPAVKADATPNARQSPLTTPAPTSASNPAPVGDRDPGGIPETLNGKPVFIGLAAVVHALATTDATQFLVGGWFHDASVSFCSGGIGLDPSPLLRGCETFVGGNAPWGGSFPGPQGRMYWNDQSLSGGRGPSIVKVHTHDRTAAACWAANRAQCRAVMVVDEVLWTGDDWTNAGPLSVVEAVNRLTSLGIVTEIPMDAHTTLSVGRRLFTTTVSDRCPTPWPHEVFELHGDPRFGLIAVFPDEAARVSAQAALDPSAPGCAADAQIVLSDAPAWVGVQNVLALVYGTDISHRAQAALAGLPGPATYTPFPPAGLDESYRVVDDAEAARAAGDLDSPYLLGADVVNDTYRRFAANALSYSIEPGRPVTKSDVGATLWAQLGAAAVPGTPRLYVVDHPGSTDPALAQEVVVTFQQQHPTLDTWDLIFVR